MFEYFDPEADSVHIAGDFNEWLIDDRSKLKNSNDGRWKKKYKLEHGHYRYKFVVDGKWTLDKNNPNIESDEVGITNSVLEID